jgi:hypothetical protein
VAEPGTAWRAAATGDFNGDGYSDIVLQNTNGSLAIWEMNGTSLQNPIALPPSLDPGAAWRLFGTGDFNGDHNPDFLFQNTQSGDVAIWEMNGVALFNAAVIASPGTAWAVKAIGDYNGDGMSDILLQNKNDGSLAMWFMNGLNLLPATTVLSLNPGTSWSPAS